MKIHGDNNMSQMKVCIASASSYKLTAKQAKEIIDRQIELIKKSWNAVCDEAKLTKLERKMLWECQFMNPFAFE
jgi:serine/threonine-protein kinase HipA